MKTNEELNTEVYEKLCAEQAKYKEWLLSLEPSEILRHAYEFVVREDIVYVMEYTELPDEKCKALLKSPDLTSEVYKIFDHMETDYMPTLEWCMEHAADLRSQKEAMRE